MRVSYKRAAVKDMEATRDYIAGRLKNPKAAKKLMTALLKAISLLVDKGICDTARKIALACANAAP